MAGRTPHLIASGGKEPRQKIWEAIRVLAPGFCVNDLARRTGQMPRDISVYLSALTKAGVVEEVAVNDSKSRQFKLAKDEGVEHPRLNSKGKRTYDHLATENIWRAIRILGGYITVQDIQSAASVGTVSLTANKVRQYLNALAEAGYLTKSEQNSGAYLREVYSLVSAKDTGPRPPEIRKLDSLQVYDPNLNKLVYVKTTGSVGADRSVVEPGIALLRSRDLLKEWLAQMSEARGAFSPSSDLIQRTQLELAAPGESGGLQ
ncbi:hypothetical protein [Pseudomonas sp. NPDC090201]|uniref:hypothetical protein n=1 Tax=Pseudomonas sp. NPDC090201 TaxID=3364475 RepID=UPI00382477DE